MDALEAESHRFGRLLAEAPVDAAVPSCPGWTVADLAWHLTGVQHFWGAIAEGLLADPDEVEEADRVDDPLLAIAHQSASHRLVEALRRHKPSSECWSWARSQGTIGWVARRQHQEAAIHRADLELALGREPRLDDETGLDGIDEVIDEFLDGFPDWGEFVPGRVVAIAPAGAERRYVEVGRFVGTSPTSGTGYDDPAVRRIEHGDPHAVISGPAGAIDLWMWGRAPLTSVRVDGDDDLVTRLRAAVAMDTQ